MQNNCHRIPKSGRTKWVSDTWLAQYFDVHRTTIWRWSKSGRLPSPEQIGENTTRWDFEKIQTLESENPNAATSGLSELRSSEEHENESSTRS